MFSNRERGVRVGQRPGGADLRTAATAKRTIKSIKGIKSITATRAEAATTDR